MRNILYSAVIVMLSLAAWSQTPSSQKPIGIMCCEQNSARILLMDENADWNQKSAILWEWSARQCADIAPTHQSWFANVTDAKRVMGGTHVIVSASGGGVALINMKDRCAKFYALAGGNTHSVELLPDGNLVSASSSGNYLRLFSTDPAVSHAPDKMKFSDVTMKDAHGVAWDFERQRLWALGGSELVRYKYNGERANPQLAEEARFKLSDPNGHDLFPIPGTHKLFVTTNEVSTFDTVGEVFEPFTEPAGIGAVKSISQREPGGPIIVMRPTESWWSDSIGFVGEDRTKTLPNAKFYKARWWVPNTFSYGDEKK